MCSEDIHTLLKRLTAHDKQRQSLSHIVCYYLISCLYALSCLDELIKILKAVSCGISINCCRALTLCLAAGYKSSVILCKCKYFFSFRSLWIFLPGVFLFCCHDLLCLRILCKICLNAAIQLLSCIVAHLLLSVVNCCSLYYNRQITSRSDWQ